MNLPFRAAQSGTKMIYSRAAGKPMPVVISNFLWTDGSACHLAQNIINCS